MSEYAIKFRHEVMIAGKEIRLTEFFKPYKIQILLPLLQDRPMLRGELRNAEEWRISFDSFARSLYEKNEYREYIGILGKEKAWLDDSAEIGMESLWDYLADAQAIMEAYQTVHGERRNPRLGMIAEITLLSRIHMHMTKLDLSLLVYTSWDRGDSKLEEQIVSFHEWAMGVVEAAQRGQRSYDAGVIEERIANYKRELADERIADTVNNICNWIQTIYQAQELSGRQYEDILKTIRKGFSDLISDLGAMYQEKKKFIRSLRTRHNLRMSRNEVFEMVISSRHYQEEKMNLFCQVVRNTENYNKAIANLYGSSFETAFQKLRKFFWDHETLKGRTVIGQKVLGNYKKGSGCFAIMTEVGGKNYFSFSNVREHIHYTSTKDQYEDLAKILMETIFDSGTKVPIADVRKHDCGYLYNWAYVSDETMRYLPLGEWNAQKTAYLSTPVALKDDSDITDMDNDKEKIGTSYGCCERKMLAFSNNSLDKIFYARWAPCARCMPAMVSDTCEIKIYALAERFDKALDMEKMTELHEYEVLPRYMVRQKR